MPRAHGFPPACAARSRFCRGFRLAPFQGQHIAFLHVLRHDAQRQHAAFVPAVAVEHAHADHLAIAHHHVGAGRRIVGLRKVDPLVRRALFEGRGDDLEHIVAVPLERDLLAVLAAPFIACKRALPTKSGFFQPM
jgi:hypothetical protein